MIQRSLSLLHGGLRFHEIIGLRLRAKVGQLGARIREIQLRAPLSEISAAALANGMRTLKQDGMEKCLTGTTHIKEVRAVCVK